MAQIPENVKEMLRGGHNVWVATIGADGWPNVAIKGSGALLDDEHIYFADIFSKKTRDNLLSNGRVAVGIFAADKKVAVRVVSMPSTTTFDREDTKYKKAVLPAGLPRIAVEMGVTDGWWKYGCAAVVGIDTFGESAPAPALFKHFKLTAENLAAVVAWVLGR
jgi:hypothetical protein